MEPIIIDNELENIMDDRENVYFDSSGLSSSNPNLSRDFEDLFFRPSNSAHIPDTFSCFSPGEMTSTKHPDSRQTDLQPSGSTPSDTRSDSPEDSSHGSSVNSPVSHLRNASLASNHSELFSPNSVGNDQFLPAGWPNAEQLSIADGSFLEQDNIPLPLKGDCPLDQDLEFSNKAMASAFDFDSAASSPSPLKMENAAMATKSNTLKQSVHKQKFPQPPAGQPGPSQSPQWTPAVNPFIFRRTGDSPVLFSGNTPTGPKYWGGLSPRSNQEELFGGINMNGSPSLASPVPPPNYRANGQHFDTLKCPPGAVFSMNDPAGAVFRPNINLDGYLHPQLIVHPTSLKSRVETQIPIKLSLFPLPHGVKKLRLPRHAISKPKFLAKPETERSPEILELRASLVCTSAMQDKKKKAAAFARARGEKISPKSTQDGKSEEPQNDEDTPSGGAEVKICSGCIQRERKRASRKKQRKPEEDEIFQRDEDKRVIVFNTTEIKDWVDPPRPSNSNAADPSTSIAPLDAMQVDLPMRIACYCRHQNEKIGFQSVKSYTLLPYHISANSAFRVIFTIRDYKDNTIAQGITNSIMITDDHKTHTPANFSTSSIPPIADSQFPIAGVFAANPAVDLSKPFIHQVPYKLSHSATDLQALRNRQYPLTPASTIPLQNGSNNFASGSVSRNLSRQASPSEFTGPLAKRRKQSGGKVPPGLAMTRMETQLSSTSNGSPLSNPNTTASQVDHPFVNPAAIAPQFRNGPPTPGNSDNMFFSPTDTTPSVDLQAQQTLISAPSSAFPSRSGSPINSSRSMSQEYSGNGSNAQSIPWNITPNLPPQQVPAMIHKLVPAEGSTTGGTEVTLLGSGFYPGMEVVFGDTLATTTTFWGEKCLNCLTPPAIKPGSVAVVFKHEHPRLGQQSGQPIIPRPQILFRYIDDRELQMYRIALGILGQKLRNPADAYQTAQQIMGGDSTSLWGLQSNFQGTTNGQQRQAPGNNQNCNVTDTDAKMLVYLEFMDLDDSPGAPKYNSRSPSGQTLLHLASSLGLTRFVAGLLARGANPSVRDKNHNTPLHLAALSGHTHIVHRLRLAGAETEARNLRGFTPADLATSLAVHQAVLVPARHYRSRSAGSTPSIRRRLSSGSLDKFWEASSSTDSADAAEDSTNDSDCQKTEAGELFYSKPKRSKTESKEQKLYFSHSREGSVTPAAVLASGESEENAEAGRSFSPPAALVAWRNQLAGQIHQFQQNVNRAFPNLPALPQLPPMPALPDYQAHPMIQRISSLVPHRPSTSWSTNIMKDGWDRLTGNSSPPAYDELYPGNENDADYDVKKASAVEAAVDTLADQHFSAEEAASSSGPASTSSLKEEFGDVQIGRKNTSKQQQEQLRKAHARKMKRFRSDRNLFVIWIPLLILIVAAMLKNLIPDIWQTITLGYEFVKSHYITGSANTPVAS
ncbi:hypothetical protein FQN57_003846 [Myotisia sp. PD_48]|nr:hypothetical protein FQN57_003846 [Myotisia sp. PD_48]